MVSKSSLNMGNHRIKIRSLGQIIEKPYHRNRGHIFSSPEHNVLKVSFSDRAMSVVRACVRPSVNIYLVTAIGVTFFGQSSQKLV